MKLSRLLAASTVLPLALLAQTPALPPGETALRIDKSRSYVDIDVKATAHSFTGRLERYETRFSVDAKGKIKTAVLTFKFADLKTGKDDRDARMLSWLGGGEPEGRFELGMLALAPNGLGQANGRLTFHGSSQLVEFPVTIKREDRTYTVTGTATVNTRNWGLKVIRFAGLLKVDPELRVRFQFTGELPPPADE